MLLVNGKTATCVTVVKDHCTIRIKTETVSGLNTSDNKVMLINGVPFLEENVSENRSSKEIESDMKQLITDIIKIVYFSENNVNEVYKVKKDYTLEKFIIK